MNQVFMVIYHEGKVIDMFGLAGYIIQPDGALMSGQSTVTWDFTLDLWGQHWCYLNCKMQ